jgi:hypothetical protein
MAKELPYFKFEPNQWENGNIQMLSREDKGLFIDLCSMYWSRLGDVPEKLVIQKLCGGNATALNSLCDEKIIEVLDGNIYIKFLSEQLNGFDDISKKNSQNAKDGWEKRRKLNQNAELSDRNATASNSQCEIDAIREEKIKEYNISFDDFWNLYDKKVGDKNKAEKMWNKLKDQDRESIMKYIPKYILSQPEKKFRLHPTSFLNQNGWESELIISNNINDKKWHPSQGSAN